MSFIKVVFGYFFKIIVKIIAVLIIIGSLFSGNMFGFIVGIFVLCISYALEHFLFKDLWR